MNSYMIEVTLPEVLSEEFVRLIPRQRAHIDDLMIKGIVTSYSLASDRSRLWVTMQATSERQVMDRLERFPLYSFFGVQVSLLAFQNMTLSPAKVWLN